MWHNNSAASTSVAAAQYGTAAPSAYPSSSSAGTNQSTAAAPATNTNQGLPVTAQQPQAGRAFPQAGMGGLSSKDPNSSPYERPTVSVGNVGNHVFTVEIPRSINEVAAQRGINNNQFNTASPGLDKFGLPIGMSGSQANNQSSAAPASQAKIAYSAPNTYQTPSNSTYSSASTPNAPKLTPAKAEITDLQVRRIMSFFLTSYEIKATVCNQGQIAFEKPFMLQVLAKTKRNPRYDLLETYLIDPLKPGQQVEITKLVDGHQFPSLMELNITFKAQVMEDVPPKADTSMDANWQTKKTRARKQRKQQEQPTVRPGSSREKRIGF